jgi:hypothetical protein
MQGNVKDHGVQSSGPGLSAWNMRSRMAGPGPCSRRTVADPETRAGGQQYRAR